MQVLQISKKDALKLRPSQRNEQNSPTPDDESAFHLGGFIDGKLVTAASFHLEKNPLIPEENQFCLDEIIVDPNIKHTQATKELLKTAFPMMKRNFTNVVWCDIRDEDQQHQQLLQELDFQPIEKDSKRPRAKTLVKFF